MGTEHVNWTAWCEFPASLLQSRNLTLCLAILKRSTTPPCESEVLYRTASQFRCTLLCCPAMPKPSTAPPCLLLLIFTPPFLIFPSVLALFLGLSRFGQQHEFT